MKSASCWRRVAVLLIGERPGLATAESLSAYMAYRPRSLTPTQTATSSRTSTLAASIPSQLRTES